MEVVPAVDLYCGKCIRLKNGRLEERTEYYDGPWLAAKRWENEGASTLHVVDLNAAFSGKPENLKAFERLRKEVSCSLQVGGGIRDIETARQWFEAGANKLVLSTLLAEDFEEAKRIAKKFEGSVLASIDLRNGSTQIRGWTRSATFPSMQEIAAAGFAGVVFTDVSRDGTSLGQDGSFLEALDRKLPFYVAGGVSSLNDIAALKRRGAAGVILGRALYDGKLSFKETAEAALC